MSTLMVFAVPVAVLWALVVFPSFRIVAAILLVAGVVGWAVISEKNEAEGRRVETNRLEKAEISKITQEKRREQQNLLWSKVPASSAEIRGVSLKPPAYSFSDEYEFKASIKNLSPVKLGGFSIEITAMDCIAKNNCETVGKSTETVWADIPSQQVRGVSTTVRLYNVPQLRGTMAVTAKVSLAIGRQRGIRLSDCLVMGALGAIAGGITMPNRLAVHG
jgi:hypothetical protein